MQDYGRWLISSKPCSSDCILSIFVSYENYYDRLEKVIDGMTAGDEMFIVAWEFRPQALWDTFKGLLGKEGVRLRILQTLGHQWMLKSEADKIKKDLEELAKNDIRRIQYQTDDSNSGGTHHQKVVYIRVGKEHRLFCGGMDIALGRSGAWHDAQVEIIGAAAQLGLETLEKRWGVATGTSPISTDIVGNCTPSKTGVTVQFAQTYRKGLPGDIGNFYPKDGDYGIHSMLKNAISKAQRTIYVQDQYLVGCRRQIKGIWTPLANLPSLECLIADRLRSTPTLNFTAITARSEQADGFNVWMRRKELIRVLQSSARDKGRVRVLQFKANYARWPNITAPNSNYVHTKTWIFDDEFAVVGSANFNRSGLSFETEFAVGITSEQSLTEFPGVPLARGLRMALWLGLLTAKNPSNPGAPGPKFAQKDVSEFWSGWNKLESDPQSPLEPYNADLGSDKSEEQWDPDGS